MISTDLLAAFAAAAFAVIIIPGPTVMLVSSYALAEGRRSALLCILGVCLGDISAMAMTFLGLGAVLAASASLFTALKWVGVAYLLYLGFQLWRAPTADGAAASPIERSPFRIVLRAFTINVLHPKGLAFHAAFLPQFLDPAYPALPQMLVLGAVFSTIAFLVLFGYALTSARFRTTFTRSSARRKFNRTGAVFLFGAGAWTATLRHGS
jgi:threonine/homoserine/homoserine lactone efflux protein